MAAITTALAAGLGTAITSAASSITAVASSAAAGVGGAAAAAGTAGTISGVAGAVGLGLQGVSAFQQREAQEEATQEQIKQEGLRKKQMELQAARERRKVVRENLIRTSQQRNIAAQTGGEAINSASLGGITGASVANEGFDINAINQNEAIGSALFASNAREANASGDASLFSGLSDFGGALIRNNAQIGRIGATVTGGGRRQSNTSFFG